MWPSVQLTYSLAESQNMKWSYYSRPTFWHCLLAEQQGAQIELHSDSTVSVKVVCPDVGRGKTQETQDWLARVSDAVLHIAYCNIVASFKTMTIQCVSLLAWCCANSLASTVVALSPGCSSSLPVLMRAAGHWGVVVSSLRQTMQFKPASGM